MSDLYAAVRDMAVNAALEEMARNVKESNDYDGVKILEMPQDGVMENRGERVDVYLRNAGVQESVINHWDTGNDHQWADYRMWCGMFIYFCYSTALSRCGRGLSLPFTGIDLWSGPRLRMWADNYGRSLTRQRRNLQYQFLQDEEKEKIYQPGLGLDKPTVAIYNEIEKDKKQKNAELAALDDLFLFRVWDKSFGFTAEDAARVIVKPGDIFSEDSGHIGMASSYSQAGLFSTIEGNQSEVKTPNLPSIVNHYGKEKKSISKCQLIIRI